MDLQLAGKRALVTGASKGIGFAVARALAAEGCHLDLAARSADGLAQARDALSRTAPGVDIRVHAVDLARLADQERLAQACSGVDILVNNAGSNPGGDLGDTTDAVLACVLGPQGVRLRQPLPRHLGAMKERRDGVIVNIIGYAGERLNARYIIGTTSNAGLMAFTRAVGSHRLISACASSASIPAIRPPSAPRPCCVA